MNNRDKLFKETKESIYEKSTRALIKELLVILECDRTTKNMKKVIAFSKALMRCCIALEDRNYEAFPKTIEAYKAALDEILHSSLGTMYLTDMFAYIASWIFFDESAKKGLSAKFCNILIAKEGSFFYDAEAFLKFFDQELTPLEPTPQSKPR